MSKKFNIGVLFGGCSAEHEVSLVSVASVIKFLDRKKYRVIPIGITKEGQWITGSPLKFLKGDKKAEVQHVLPPTDFRSRGLVIKKTKSISVKKIDVFFPVLHGPYGEDGTIQGMLEMTGIPYVGAGVVGSVLGMDKVFQKQIYNNSGIPTPKFIYFSSFQWKKNSRKIINNIKKEIGFPCFIKPANLGSSIGISKVYKVNDLKKALVLALKYDHKVIVEKSIENSREIEIALLGNENPKVSVPGEILSSNEFYDYNAKYVDGKSKTLINPKIKKTVLKKIIKYAKEAFTAINCLGMARADFLIKGNNIYLNELNTIPGFTSISMYPRLWIASGLSYSKLLDKLIELAFLKSKKKKNLQTNFKLKSEWFR